MNALSLNVGADWFVATFRLTEQNEKIVKTCVLRYTKPDSCCEAVAWVIHRIINAIKHIFGCSDWQNALQAIQELDQFASIKNNLEKKNQIQKFNDFSEMLLTSACQLHEDKAKVDFDVVLGKGKFDIKTLLQ